MLTANDLTVAIARARYRKSFCLPRYTPKGWYECDLFAVTPAGYWQEYEVKVSMADFRKDAFKSREYFGQMISDRRSEKKHEQLASGDERGPSAFYFVMPKELATVASLPIWAGLISVEKISGRFYHDRIMKVAPKLHGKKVDDKIIKHARGICYWRMHNLLTAERLAVMHVENTGSADRLDELNVETGK